MDERRDVSWKEAWQRKRLWATLVNKKVTHLLFLTIVCVIIALILFSIPASGTALLVMRMGGLALALLGLVFGIRAAWIYSRAQKHIASYRQALNLPSPAASPRSQWEDRILHWCFRVLTAASILFAFGELALLWQEQPAARGHLILLAVTLLIAAGGVFILRNLQPPTPPKQKKEQERFADLTREECQCACL